MMIRFFLNLKVIHNNIYKKLKNLSGIFSEYINWSILKNKIMFYFF